MFDAIVEHPIVDVPSARAALALTFKNTRLVIIPRSSRSIYSLRQHRIYHGCAPDSGPLIYFVPMLPALKRVQPSFIELMYAEAVRVLPDGGLWTYEAKLDGYRCLAAKRSEKALLWSRRGNGFTGDSRRLPAPARTCRPTP